MDLPDRPSGGARTRQRLIGLNIALLIMLGVVTIFSNVEAGAQPGATPAPRRPRGDYTVVSGRYQGSTTNAVYVMDAANQELLALTWDRSRNELNVLGHRKLGDDSQIKPGR